MDGTLINSKKEISKENLDAIKYFVNNGGKFTVATGRMVASVSGFLDKLKLDLPAILHNGGKIYDYNGGGIDEGVRIRIRIRIKLGINISVKRIVRSSDFLQILVGEK